jgi:hypothetical protein
MNSKFESELQYLTARRKYEKLLREQRWEPSTSHASAAFVKPFTDVFKALKLTAMDIGNSARLMLGVLLTFDSKKLEKKISDFEERRNVLRQEWQPIVGDSLKAIQTADPLLSMALMPTAYLASFGLATGITTGAAVVDVIAGEKWERLVSQLWNMPTELAALGAIKGLLEKQNEALGEKSGVLKGLLNLFWKGEKNESVLREQKKGKTTYDTSSEEAWLADFFADTGLDDTFDALAAESARNHLDLIRDVENATRRAEAVALLVAADDPEKFKTVLQQVVSGNLIEAADVKEISSVLPEIDKQAKQLAVSDDFRNKVATMTKTAPEKVNEKDLMAAAQKAAFNAAKIGFNEKAMNGDGGESGLSNFMQQIKKMQKEVELDSKTLQQLKKKTDIPEIKELLSVYEGMNRSYDKAQQAINAAVGSSKQQAATKE